LQTDVSKFSNQAFQPQSRRTLQHMDGRCEHGWKSLQTEGKLSISLLIFHY